MIDDDTQLGDQLGKPRHFGQHLGTAIDIELQIMLDQAANVIHVSLIFQAGLQRPMIDSQTTETRVFRESRQVPGEFRRPHGKIPYQPHNKRISLGQIEDPLVVLHSRASLDDNCPSNLIRLGQSLEFLGQHRPIQQLVTFARPGRPIFAGGIEEVRVRIDDRVDTIRSSQNLGADCRRSGHHA